MFASVTLTCVCPRCLTVQSALHIGVGTSLTCAVGRTCPTRQSESFFLAFTSLVDVRECSQPVPLAARARHVESTDSSKAIISTPSGLVLVFVSCSILLKQALPVHHPSVLSVRSLSCVCCSVHWTQSCRRQSHQILLTVLCTESSTQCLAMSSVTFSSFGLSLLFVLQSQGLATTFLLR